MEKEKYYILSCSFGKDSLYLLHYILENGMPLNEIQFVMPMFDDSTPSIQPCMQEFIEYVMSRFPELPWTIIKSEYTYTELYKKYGAPSFRGCHWCTGWLKTKPLNNHNKSLKEKYDIYTYVGLCSDEEERVIKNKNPKNIYPLYTAGIKEEKCFEWCQANDLLAPVYNMHVHRDGCWHCPFQTKKSWTLLKSNYPALFEKLCRLEETNETKYPYHIYNKPLRSYINGYISPTIFDFMEDEE